MHCNQSDYNACSYIRLELVLKWLRVVSCHVMLYVVSCRVLLYCRESCDVMCCVVLFVIAIVMVIVDIIYHYRYL
jgi:hypothetical protein